MYRLRPFLSVPRPANGSYGRFRSRHTRGKFDHRVYFSDAYEKSLVAAAAKACDCSVSEYLRQLGVTTALAMGVESDDCND